MTVHDRGAQVGDLAGADNSVGYASSSNSNLIGWAAANSIGLSVALSVPLWIGDFAGRFGLPPWAGGVAATVEMGMAATANILWAALSPRYPSRWLVAGLVLAVALAQQLVALDHFALASVGLIVAGLASGSLLAVLNRQVALSHAPHRGYAILSFLHVGYGVALYLVAPRLQAQFGHVFLFQLLSIIALAGAPLMWFLPAGRRHSPMMRRTEARVSLFGVIGLVGLASIMVGHEAIAAYMVRLGEPLHLSRIDVSGIMASASAIGLCGPLLAGLLPARFGYARLIGPSLAAMALLDISLHYAASQFWFAACFVSLQTLLVFAVPRILGYLAVLDESGRSGGMGPASLLIGSSLGPVLGNLVGAPVEVEGVPFAAAVMAILACLMITAVAIRRRRLLAGN
jgi:predicted MFS family arabinose efflux permease